MTAPHTKLCKTCGESKPLEQMAKALRKGRTYYRHLCRECDNARGRRYWHADPAKHAGRVRAKTTRDADRRRSPSERYHVVWLNCRGNDSRHHRENDLTKEDVRLLLADGCSYCGEHDPMQLTLDRIDNDLGHLRGNVVPACARCNLVRRNMPYTAWLVVAPGMRTARELGLFGGWEGGGNPRKSETPISK